MLVRYDVRILHATAKHRFAFLSLNVSSYKKLNPLEILHQTPSII